MLRYLFGLIKWSFFKHSTTPYIILGRVWYLIVSTPDLCTLTSLELSQSFPIESSLRASPCLSSVPQGSVLMPILFLIFINDLPDNINSSVCLFTYDCVLYSSIYLLLGFHIFHEDLNSLALGEADWQMKVYVAKCHFR